MGQIGRNVVYIASNLAHTGFKLCPLICVCGERNFIIYMQKYHLYILYLYISIVLYLNIIASNYFSHHLL